MFPVMQSAAPQIALPRQQAPQVGPQFGPVPQAPQGNDFLKQLMLGLGAKGMPQGNPMAYMGLLASGLGGM